MDWSAVVIGLGNPDRGDDGIGPAVVALLAGRVPAGVRLRTRRADLLALIDDWRDAGTAICIDAAVSLGMPGRVHRIDLERQTLPPEFRQTSSHAFGLAEAVELSRTLHLRLPRIVVYAVEGIRFDTGAPMSAEVRDALHAVADAALADLRAACRHQENTLHV